ncbi:MAG: RusA family crossover junction endodeoxyribonuclease [Pseudomonadota bacterium]
MDGGLKLIPGRTIVFTVAGLPKGKGRPRGRIVWPAGIPKLEIKGRKWKLIWPSKKQPFIQFYTPADTTALEKEIAWKAKAAMKGKAPIDGPVKVSIFFGIPIAPSLPKYRQKAIRDGLEACLKKPDEDNVGKLIKDALNKVVYKDDSMIVRSTVIKDFTDTPRISVRVTELVVPDKIPSSQTESCPKPSREKGTVKNGEAAGAGPVKSAQSVKDDASAQASQSRQPKSETDGEPARAQCGFDGLAMDCPNHSKPGAPWCAACRPPGLR